MCLLFCFVLFWILCCVVCEKKKKKKKLLITKNCAVLTDSLIVAELEIAIN